MPNINLIPVNLFTPTDAYHHIVDNRPLEAILTRIDLVNSQVDNNTDTLRLERLVHWIIDSINP